MIFLHNQAPNTFCKEYQQRNLAYGETCQGFLEHVIYAGSHLLHWLPQEEIDG